MAPKKKTVKQQDFAKPKLKVGKTKPAASNATSTSFSSKSIVLRTQLTPSAPQAPAQLHHHLSLLSHHAPQTRKASLQFLSSHLPSETLPPSQYLPATFPLILDLQPPVRAALRTLYEGLPPAEFRGFAGQAMLYLASGASHIAPDIRADSAQFLNILLDKTGVEGIRGAGWAKAVGGMVGVLGWVDGKVRAAGMQRKTLEVLGRVLEVGLEEEEERGGRVYGLPVVGGVYDYLGLWGGGGEGGDPEDVDARRRWLAGEKKVLGAIRSGLEAARKEGGEVGRIAKRVEGTLERGLAVDIDGDDNNDA